LEAPTESAALLARRLAEANASGERRQLRDRLRCAGASALLP